MYATSGVDPTMAKRYAPLMTISTLSGD